MDKETLSLLPSGTTSSRGCSPVAWLSRPTAADQNTAGKSGDGSPEKANVFSVGRVINENSPGDKSVSQPTAFNANTVSSPTAVVVAASRTPGGPVINGPVKPSEQARPSPSTTTQVKPCQGQGFAAERLQGQLQIGATQTSVSRSQAVPGSQVGHGLIRSSTTVPVPGTQGSQVSTNVPGSQSIPEAQVGQVRHQGPAILPAIQSTGIVQGPPVLNKGPTTLPGPQTISGIRIPGSAVLPGPQIIPGVPSLPGAQRGPGSVIAPRPQSTFVPASPPGSQTARLQGPMNVLRYEATPGAHQTGQAPGVGSSTPGAQGGSQTTMLGSQFVVPATQSSQPISSHYPTSAMARTPTTPGGLQSVLNAVVASNPITGTSNQISTQINESSAAAKHAQNPAAATANSGGTNIPAVASNPAQTTTAKLAQTTANHSGLKQVVANGPQIMNSQCLNIHTNAATISHQIVTISNPTLAKSAALPALGQNTAAPANGVITVNRNAAIIGQTHPPPGAGQRDASRPSVCPLGPVPMTLSSVPAQAVGSRPTPKISPPNGSSTHNMTNQNSVHSAMSKVNASSINGQNPSPGGVPAAPSNVPFHASNQSPNIPNNNNSIIVSNNYSASNVSMQRFGGTPTGDKVTPHGAWRGGGPTTAGEVPYQSPTAVPTAAVGRELPQPLSGNMTTRGCQLYASINANPPTVGVKSSFPGGSLPGNSSFQSNATSTSLPGSKENTQNNPVLTSATNAKHP